MIRDRGGNAALEFALVGPVFLAMMLALVEYSRLYWTAQSVAVAVAQAARCVAVASSACSSGGAAYAASLAQGYGVALTSSQVTVTNKPGAITNQSACSPPGATTNAFTLVSATFSFNSAVGTIVPGLNQTLTIKSCYPITGS